MAFLSWIVRRGKKEQPVCQPRRADARPLHTRTNAVITAFSDPPRAILCRVLRAGIIACVASTTASAQQPLPSLDPPAPRETLGSFNLVRAALLADTSEPLPNFGHGACVVLRLDGRIIARGQAFGEDALGRAVALAGADLARQVPPAADVAAERVRTSELARAALSLELAGPPIPLRMDTFAEVDAGVQPGLDGVGVRRGARVEVVFPSTGQVFGRLAGDMLASAIAELLDDATAPLRGTPSGELGPLVRTHGLEVFRFRVAHVAQTTGSASPGFLHRGARPAGPMTLADLRALERAYAEHLAGRLRRDGPRSVLLGTHHAGTGRDQPEVAPPAAQALACLALVTHARGAADEVEALPSLAVARSVLRSLTNAPEGEPPLWEDVEASAAWLLAAGALMHRPSEPAPADPEDVARIDAAVAGAFSAERGWSPRVPEHARGLVACALASRVADAREGDTQAARTLANGAVRSLFRETQAQRWVMHMPWLAHAEVMLAEGRDTIPAASALREFRALAWAHQRRGVVDPDDCDFEGGIVFTGSGNPFPTWQTAGVLATMALLAPDPRLTDEGEAMAQVVRLAAGAGFLRRLTIDDDGAWLAADRARAIGGVRVAPWDPRLPLEATAMALLATSQSRRAIEAIATRSTPGRTP